MKIKGLKGGPEDLIRRCDDCDYCIFEEVLTEEQRKIKVLDNDVPVNHAHRVSLEYACGQQHDKVNPLLYAAMRAIPGDERACQLGAIKDFMWDLGKKYKRPVHYLEAMPEWTKEKDLGREKLESFAGRFRDLWNLGLREIKKNGTGDIIMVQTLTSPGIYGMIASSPKLYEDSVEILTSLKEEAEERARA